MNPKRPASHAVGASLGLTIVLIACTTAIGDELVIVDDGRTSYEIVVAARAFPTTLLAARELQHFIATASGVTLPIVRRPSPARAHLFLRSSESLDPDAFEIRARGRDIVFTGGDGPGGKATVDFLDPVNRGTCNAVYDFLERFLGVRWFWGDDLGQVVPRSSRVVVPSSIDIRQAPRFDYRALAYGPPDTFHGRWARRNRLGAAHSMHHGHNLQHLVPVEYWARRGHPEYAAMIQGRRKTSRTTGHVCTSNPEVVQLVVDGVTDLFRRVPSRKMCSISPPDGSAMCQDDLCVQYDVPGYKVPRGSRRGRPVKSDRFLHFYNAVAEAVAHEFPDRLLGAYIYHDYLYPPRRETSAHPNLALVVAPNLAYESAAADVRQFERELYAAWGAFHHRVYAHDILYHVRRSFGLPAPIGAHSRDLIRTLAENKFRGAYLYIGPTWETTGAESYVLARLLWNPDADFERLEREYYGVLYQTAAGAVREYFATAERCAGRAVTASPEEIARYAPFFHRSIHRAREPLARLLIGYGDSLPKFERLVKEAERRAIGDEQVVRRVARLRDSFELSRATITALDAVTAYERDRSSRAETQPRIRRAIDARRALLRRVGRSYGAELRKALQFADDNLETPFQRGGYYDKLADVP